jgi:hypothetical protein
VPYPRPLPRRHARAELFYEIARKLPKSSPVTAPASGLVLIDKTPLKKKSQCC